MRRTLGLAAVLLAAAAAPAAAQNSAEEGRFFVDKVDDEDGTLWQGSLTSTSFLHREVAGVTDPAAGQPIENAAPTRWFTDLRAQVDARHIGGNAWDARIDTRVRMVNTIASPNGGVPELQPQSGSLSGNELEVRELFVVRGTTRTDLYVGRQHVLDLAAMKIDGLRLDYAKNERWTYFGFGGLYPVRGSRSVLTDYPGKVNADNTPAGGRVMPATAGLGGAYRTERTYGAIGVAGIVPLANDAETGTMEQPRLFVGSNGYWRRSASLDVYHYGVLDIIGSGGFAITNASLGVSYRPQMRLHVNAAFHRVDTETLAVQAQTLREDPDTRDVGVIQNNVAVSRIASDSARASISAALGKTMRWEVTVGGSARRRPEVTLEADAAGVGEGTDVVLPSATSGEIYFQAVDRDFYGDLRLSASFARVFGLGSGNPQRSASTIASLGASREIADGKGEWEATARYLASLDENRAACAPGSGVLDCYGSAQVSGLGLDGTVFYRLKRDWMLMAMLELSRTTLTTLDGGMTITNPAITGLTGFLRVAYRF